MKLHQFFESRQMKDPTKDSMVHKDGKTIVIDKSKEKDYLKKGWQLAETALTDKEVKDGDIRARQKAKPKKVTKISDLAKDLSGKSTKLKDFGKGIFKFNKDVKEGSDFKKRELEYELRHEEPNRDPKKRRPYRTPEEKIRDAKKRYSKAVGVMKGKTDEATKDVKEGTWALPDTEEQMERLKELMAKPLPCGPGGEFATEKLGNLIGDDELFDDIGELGDSDPNADCRDIVIARAEEFGINLKKGPNLRLVDDEADMGEGLRQQFEPEYSEAKRRLGNELRAKLGMKKKPDLDWKKDRFGTSDKYHQFEDQIEEGEERSDIQALMRQKCEEWLNSVQPRQYMNREDLESEMYDYARGLTHDDLGSSEELRNFMYNPGDEASEVVQDVLSGYHRVELDDLFVEELNALRKRAGLEEGKVED